MFRRTALLFNSAAVLTFIPFKVAAQITAVGIELRGRVQLLLPGGTWIAATLGAMVDKGIAILSGFNSTAALRLGRAIVTVRHGQNNETDGQNPPGDSNDQFDYDTDTQLPGTNGGTLCGGDRGGQTGCGSLAVTL